VDLTPDRGLGRDPIRLREAAVATGLHIICGTGFYVESAHPSFVATASVEELARHMTREILTGIEDSGIRAGVIGELGVSHPVTSAERKVLEAGALSQRQTGAAISIHTAFDFPDANSALTVAEILVAAGADLSRVIMGHMDTAVSEPSYLLAVAEKGCVIEFDLFGNETFHSEYSFAIPGDSEKIHAVVMLIQKGFARQLLLSHDTATKTQLTRYGGYGYGHLLRNIALRLELAGLGPADVDGVLRANPQRLFPLQTSIGDYP
jgi:phosphotriesterase-related protein